MRRLVTSIALLAAASTFATAMLGPPAALAGPAQVIADCNTHNQLTHSYSTSELRAALSTMPADVKEYTDCSDVIERALLARLGGSHRRPATGSAAASGGSGGSGGSFLPAPLVVVLVLLALAAITLGAVAVRRRRHT